MKSTSSQFITVSVVIPTICRKSLVRAIDSVCNQLGSVLREIVVCFDNTENNLIPDYDHVRNGVNIRVLHNHGQYGVASTLNCAINEATGTLIAWLSDDDYFSSPIRLLRIINMINRNDWAAMRDGLFLFSDFHVFSDYLPVNIADTDHIFNPQLNYVGAHVEDLDSCYEYGQRCLSKGLINGCATVFSKELWTLVGGFPVHKDLQTTQDTVFWMSIIEKSLITAYIEDSNTTSVQHALQSQNTFSEIMAGEIEQLKTVVHIKNLRDFQLKRFTLKEHFNFFYQCMLLSVAPVSVFSQADNSSILQLSTFEFEQNTISLLCHAHRLPGVADAISVWESCVSALRHTLGSGDYSKEFFDKVLHFYIDVNGVLFRLYVWDSDKTAELAACIEYNKIGDILFDYRYIVTGEFAELMVDFGAVLKHFETLLLSDSLCEYWSYLDERNLNVTRVNQLIVRAPWSFTEKP